MKRLLVLAALAIGLAIAWASPAAAQEGQDVYEASCSACHQSDGNGIPGSFPPLTGNPAAADANHVESVIRNGLDGPLEVLGQTYNAVMPAVAGLSDAEIAAVVAYVTSLAGDASTPTETTVPAPRVGTAAAGEDLFVGRNSLDNGGLACVACHSAGSVGQLGGDGLGPDLTDLFRRFGGGAGVAAALANPPSPTMTPIFADHPLTEDEISDLVAFFEAADAAGPDDDPELLALLGGLGLVGLVGLTALVFKRPRQSYVQKLRSNP